MSSLSRLRLTPKLILAFLAAGIIPIVAVAFISLRTSGELRTQASTVQEQEAGSVLDTIDRNLFERYGDVQAFAQSQPAREMDAAGLKDWMDRMMGTYTPIYNLMVVADLQGRIIAANRVDLEGKPLKTDALLGTNVASEPWFKDTIANYEPAVTRVGDIAPDPLAGKVFGAESPQGLSMTFSYPILDDAGTIVGVWSNRFNTDVISQIFTDKLAGASGEHYALINTAGKVLIAGGEGAPTFGADAAGQEGFVAAKDAALGVGSATSLATGRAVLQGYAKSKGYSIYPGVGWTLTADKDESLALGAATGARNQILLAGAFLVLLIGVAAWFLARSFARPITTFKAEMEEISRDRDLQRRVTVDRHDEIGEIGETFNGMMSEFHEIIRGVGTNADRLKDEASRSGHASSEAGRAALEIATTIETIAAGAVDQARQARAASQAMADITRGALEVADRGEQAAAAAVQADEAAAGGSQTLREATAAMQEIEQAVTSAAEVVERLGAKGQEIGHIVDTISEIAEQTNLLALNAAIEAARAGEQGRGFAVVADEVRKLAEEASSAAASIASLVTEVQSESRHAVQAMSDGTEAVRSGSSRMGAVDEAFDVIRSQAGRAKDDITQVATAAEALQAGTRAAESALEQMVQLTDSNASASEEVAASAEETGAATEDAGRATSLVSRSSAELTEMVGVFRVGEHGPVDGSVSPADGEPTDR